MVRLAALTVFFLLPFAPLAAEPPPLDDKGRAMIVGMSPLTDVPVPDLDGKIVVVSFFASWCPPCTAEFRELNKLRTRLPEERVAIVALNIFELHFKKDSAARMTRFLDRTKPTFAALGGEEDRRLADTFGGVRRIPSVYVYDPAGVPITAFIHEKGATKMHATADELETAIRPHLADG